MASPSLFRFLSSSSVFPRLPCSFVLPFIWLGTNAITIFVGANCLETALTWFCVNTPSNNIITKIRDDWMIDGLGLNGGLLTYAFLKVGFWIAIAALMARAKWFVKI